MPVIKEFESRVADIECLKGLIRESGSNSSLKKRLETELRKIRMGDQAEQNAGYLIGSIYKDLPESFLINGLRLDFDGDVAQIDHITLNSIGVVFLFETKTFSTGIKIDDEGVFWRWDDYRKTYIEIPSPIEQSKRHERVVRHALEKIGYKPEVIKHFVVVDYKATLIKPKSGFENICRPDMVEKAIKGSLQKTNIFTAVKIVGKMISGKKHSPLQTKMFARKLVELNSPINFNFRTKFGLKAETSQQSNKVAEPKASYKITKQEIAKPTTDLPDKLTLSKFAKSLSLKTSDIETMLIDQGYLERREKGVYLSQKGKDNDMEVRKAKYGFYFLIPKDFSLDVVTS